MVRSLTVRRIEFTERPVRFRMPFRFGAAKVEGAPQLFVHAEIELGDGTRAQGAAAELMVPNDIVKVEEIPVLGSGKTDYVSTRKLAIDRLGLGVAA